MDRLPRTLAILTLGSNIERERYLPEAIRMLRRHEDIDVREVSQFFESASVGGPDDAPDYYNVALLVCSPLDPEALRHELRLVEENLGRVRTNDPNEPRTIDIDIAYFGDVVEKFDGWELPDPDAITEPHIAIPIAEIARDWIHPVDGRTMGAIAKSVRSSDLRKVRAIKLSEPHVTRAIEDFDSPQDVYAPRFEALVRQQLIELGEQPSREGLERTPLRVAKAFDFLTSGYTTSLEEVVNDAIFDAEGADEMVLVKDIEFYSLCEHHMLPFYGKAAVGYLPKGKIIGLSKVARIVDLFARRLQVQERLTNQIADAVGEVLDPLGVAVVIEGQHFCMMMRGVQKQDSSMITSAMRGTFRSDPRTRSEFLSFVSK
ncbi:GTP cyclohydrolase I type 1 [hydrothermal vent metagenome]|uniref:GTP cyclohydrolase I type 1 n=1 Tax=hydrothermal vent metagenome TaxID=652676 RepID=A0A3B0SRW4_9ZZZZ